MKQFLLLELLLILTKRIHQFDGEFNTTDYWLPSFNAKWNLNDEALIRFGVSKAITRPNVSQLRADQVAVANLGYDVDDSVVPGIIQAITPQQISIYGGNPDLDAITSWNFDVSYEHYFGDDNSFTLSLIQEEHQKQYSLCFANYRYRNTGWCGSSCCI